MTDTDRKRAGMTSKSSCSVEGCDRPYRCSGYCRLHYNRVRATGSAGGPELLYMPTVGRTCSQEGCLEPVRSRGFCNAHYQRLLAYGSAKDRPAKPLCCVPKCSKWDAGGGYCRKHAVRIAIYGDPLAQYELGKPLPEGVELRLRVLNRSVRLENGCIQYLGRDRAKNGYVSIGFRAKKWRVHRAMYEVSVGPIPTGTAPDGSDWTIDHLCCRVDCVNVEHMEVVSRRENLRRRTERNATREAPVPCEDCPKDTP